VKRNNGLLFLKGYTPFLSLSLYTLPLTDINVGSIHKLNPKGTIKALYNMFYEVNIYVLLAA